MRHFGLLRRYAPRNDEENAPHSDGGGVPRADGRTLLAMAGGKILAWPNWLKIFFIIGINLSIFFLTYFLILRPTQQQQQENNLKIMHLTAELKQSTSNIPRKLPSFKPFSLSSLITEINNLAAKNNLNLVALKPSPPSNQQGIKMQSLQIEAVGTYESSKYFLSNLSQISATITLGDCVLQKRNTILPLEIILTLHFYTKEL